MSRRSCPAVALLVASLIAASFVQGADRPELYQFAPPYPRYLPPFASDVKAPILQIEAIETLYLHVDEQGLVHQLTADSTGHSGLVKYVEDYLCSIEFVPALFRGQEVSSILPVEVRLRAGDGRPRFEFPIDSAGSPGDGRLYFATFPLNDITLPGVVRFPSYYGTPYQDTLNEMYPYLLMVVDLDSSGQYVDSRMLASTFPMFERQLLTALLWSEFKSATVKGKTTTSAMYLLVSFFGSVAYPTTIWPPVSSDTANLLDRLRIRTFANRVGLLTPALPKRYPHDTYPLGANHSFRRDTVVAFIVIDTSGHARVLSCDPTHRELRLAVREAVHNSRFYPALDFEGKPQKFKGSAVYEFNGTPNVRIRYHWLK